MRTLPKFFMTLVFSFLFILIGGCDDDDSVAEAVKGIVLSESALSIVEDAQTADYTIKLKFKPASDVTVTPETGDDSVATVAKLGAGGFPLTFTSNNWETAQTVRVTTVDNGVDQEGTDRTAVITHALAGGYAGVSGPELEVTATDDDTKGVTVSTRSFTIREDGRTGYYSIVLDSQPAADVMVTYVNASTDVVTVAATGGSPLTFSNSSWSAPQGVAVTGVGNTFYSATPRTSVISHTVTGSADYRGMAVESVTVTAEDNESAPAPAGGGYALRN